MRPRSSVVAARVGRLAAAGCLVVLAPACGDDATRYAAGRAASGAPHAGPNGSDDGGEASVEALFERAQRAVSSGDDLELLRCVRRETREGWLRDLVVDVALESTDQPVDGDVMRARRKEVRRILERHGAKLGARPKTLDTSSLGAALLENVRDHDALLAALLGVARREGAPYDPARILVETDAPTPTGLPLVRLVDRLRAPARLVALEDVSSATPIAGSANVPPIESSASLRLPSAGRAAPRTSASAASLGPASSASARASASPTFSAAAAPVPIPDGEGVVFVTSGKQVLPLRIFGASGRVWLDES